MMVQPALSILLVSMMTTTDFNTKTLFIIMESYDC